MPYTKSRVLILDPDFEHDGGHNYVTNQILAGRLRSQVHIACSKTLPVSVALEDAQLCRVFPRNSYVLEEHRSPLQKLIARLGAHNRIVGQQAAERAAFAKIIATQLEGMDASAQDYIHVHTGSCFLFDALLDALETWPTEHWPALHLRQLDTRKNLSGFWIL